MLNTITSLWIGNAIALAILIARLLLRKFRREPFNAGDYWTMNALVFLIIRCVLSHFILVYGTTIECCPLSKCWQLTPDPGSCVQGRAWIITYGVTNVITDLMLLAVPLPLLFQARMPIWKRIRLVSIFSFGFLLTSISIVCLVQSNEKAHIQLSRIMWASIETLFAAFVATVPSFYIMLRPRQRSPSCYEPGARSDDSDLSGDSKRKRKRQHMSLQISDISTGDLKSPEWTELKDVDKHIAEDASTKGILVSTTVSQV